MKTLLSLLLVLILCALPLSAQNLYSPFPTGIGGFLQFSYNNGSPVSLGFLCAYASGTTTNLATYQTPTGTANANPVALDSAGRASIYLQTLAYTLILYAPGTGNTCNGVTVGALIKSVDNVLAPTLGPFTGATWNGLAVTPLYGGTGLNTSALSGVPSINAGTWSVNAITQNGIPYGGAANAISFTSAPSANSVLTVSGGVPVWSATPQVTRMGFGGAADGTIPVLITGAAATDLVIVKSTGSTTGYNLINFTNTGGNAYFGINGSIAADVVSGGQAYATVLATNNATNLNLGTNGTNRVTIASDGSSIQFGTTTVGGVYLSNTNAINGQYASNANDALHLNYVGYNGGTTQFRDLSIDDGKGTPIGFFQGSTARFGIGTTSPAGTLDANGSVILGDGTNDVKFRKALVALGGGAAPTLGTIGGSGPAAAAQNTWFRFLDSTGAAAWIPVWK